MKVDDAPIFVKSIGALLILTSVFVLLSVFITVVESKYFERFVENLFIFMLLQSLYCFAMIWLAYGLMIKKRWCYFGWIIMAIISIIWMIISYTHIFKYVLIALFVADIALLILYPRSRRYCLDNEVVPAEEQQIETEQQ